jgi:hypothetical protein
MGYGFAVIVVGFVVGWYVYWLAREDGRTGAGAVSRVAGREVECVGCGEMVPAVRARLGTCGASACLDRVVPLIWKP